MEKLMNLSNEMNRELNEFVQNYFNNVEQGIQDVLAEIDSKIAEISTEAEREINNINEMATRFGIVEGVQEAEARIWEQAEGKIAGLVNQREQLESQRSIIKDRQNKELLGKIKGFRESLESAIIELQAQVNTPINLLELQTHKKIQVLEEDRKKQLAGLNEEIKNLQLAINEASKNGSESVLQMLKTKRSQLEAQKEGINADFDRQIEKLKETMYPDKNVLRNIIAKYEKIIKNAQYVENHPDQFAMEEMDGALFSTLIAERENAKIPLTTAEAQALEGAMNTILSRGFKDILANSTLGIEKTGELSADKLFDLLERLGIVGPVREYGGNVRPVLTTREELTEEKIRKLIDENIRIEQTESSINRVQRRNEIKVEPAARKAASKSTPVEEAPVEEAPVEEAPVEETPAEEIVEETAPVEAEKDESIMQYFEKHTEDLVLWFPKEDFGFSYGKVREFIISLNKEHQMELAKIYKAYDFMHNGHEDAEKLKKSMEEYYEKNLKDAERKTPAATPLEAEAGAHVEVGARANVEEPAAEEVAEEPVAEEPTAEEVAEEPTAEEVASKSTPAAEVVEEAKKIKEAIRVILEKKQASIVGLNSELKYGIVESIRLLEILEELGIVEPAQGMKPRKILMTKEELTEEKIDALVNKYCNIEKETPVEEAPAEETAPEEIVEEPAPVEVGARANVEEPAAEEVAEEPVAEEPAAEERPVEEAPAEEVAAEEPAEEPAEEMLSKEQLLNIFNERQRDIAIWMGLFEHIRDSWEGNRANTISMLYLKSLDEKHKIELASICKSAKDWQGVEKHREELEKYYEDNLKAALPKFVVNYLLKKPIDIHVNEQGISINGINIDPETIRGHQENTVEEYIDELLDKNCNYDMNIIRAIVIKDQPTVVDGKCELSELAKKRLDTYCAMIDSPEANMDKGKITYDLKKMSGLRGFFAGSKWEKDDVDDIKESAKIAEELGCATVNVGFLTKFWWGIRRAIEGNNTPLIEESTKEESAVEESTVEGKGQPTTVRVASAALTPEQYEEQQHHQQEIAEAFSKPGENGGKDEKLEDIVDIDIDIPF